MIRWVCLRCHATGAVPAWFGTSSYDRIVSDHARAVTHAHRGRLVTEVPRAIPTLGGYR